MPLICEHIFNFFTIFLKKENSNFTCNFLFYFFLETHVCSSHRSKVSKVIMQRRPKYLYGIITHNVLLKPVVQNAKMARVNLSYLCYFLFITNSFCTSIVPTLNLNLRRTNYFLPQPILYSQLNSMEDSARFSIGTVWNVRFKPGDIDKILGENSA